MSRVVALVAALLLARATALPAADVLLVERPAALRIVDRYQQTVANPSSAGLAPFAPMTIIRERETLSDGFTPAVRVDMGGAIFFLLSDERGGLLRVGDPGEIRRYRGVQPMGDTIAILRTGELPLQDPLRRTTGSLRAGTLARREFRLGSDTYVRILDNAGRYGWVRLSAQGRLWQPYRSASPEASHGLEGTEKRVRELLSQVNTLLDSLYAFMNTRSRAARMAPRWEIERTERGLTCVLRGLADPEAMVESTAALARRIELAVSGSGVRVMHSAGTISIRP